MKSKIKWHVDIPAVVSDIEPYKEQSYEWERFNRFYKQ